MTERDAIKEVVEKFITKEIKTSEEDEKEDDT